MGLTGASINLHWTWKLPNPICRQYIYICITPLKTNMSQKRDYFSREYIFQPLIFRGNVSFQGSRWLYIELSGSDLLRLIIWAVVRYPADKKLHPPKIRKHHLGHYIYIYLHPTYINKKYFAPARKKNAFFTEGVDGGLGFHLRLGHHPAATVQRPPNSTETKG